MPFDCVRKVPWVETEAVDQGTHTPSRYDVEEMGNVTEKLCEQDTYRNFDNQRLELQPLSKPLIVALSNRPLELVREGYIDSNSLQQCIK